MRNVWKGLAVGAVTGAAIGIVLDGLDRIGRHTTDAAGRTRTGAKHLLEAVEDKLHDT